MPNLFEEKTVTLLPRFRVEAQWDEDRRTRKEIVNPNLLLDQQLGEGWALVSYDLVVHSNNHGEHGVSVLAAGLDYESEERYKEFYKGLIDAAGSFVDDKGKAHELKAKLEKTRDIFIEHMRKFRTNRATFEVTISAKSPGSFFDRKRGWIEVSLVGRIVYVGKRNTHEVMKHLSLEEPGIEKLAAEPKGIEPSQDYNVADFASRFRAVAEYAGKTGFGSGFPNFHQADYGRGTVFGTVLVKKEAMEWRDVPIRELGDPKTEEERFRAVANYAGKHGFGAGFPNFHQADYRDGRGTVVGTVLIKKEAMEWRDVPKQELGNPGTTEERFRALANYAGKHGFGAGFPNFHQADYGRGTVFGSVFLKKEAMEWRDVPEEHLTRAKRR